MTPRDLVFFILVVGVAVLAPLPYGSTGPKAVTICLLMLAAAQLFAPRWVDARAWRRLLPAFVLIAIYCVLALLQTLPGPLPADAVWSSAADLLGVTSVPSYSVDPDHARFAIGMALLTGLALLGGLGLAQIRGGSSRFLQVLGWAGLAYALFAIVMHVTRPGMVLVTPKTTHIGNLTGTFFNRNTEAAFLGLILTVHVVRLGSWIRAELPFRRNLLRDAVRFRGSPDLFLRLAAMLPIVLALLMTASRAGILISFATVAAGGIIIALGLPTRRRWTRGRVGKRVAFIVLPLLAVLAIGGAGLDARIRDEGLTDEARALTYASSFELIREHPWLGHGVGAFEAVFPAKRSPEGALLGIWNKAHSTPLEYAVEAGLPFALAVIACFIFIAWQCARAMLGQPRREILLVGTLVLVQSGLHSLVDYPLQIPGFGIIVAVIAGAATGATVQSRFARRATKRPGTPAQAASEGSEHAGKAFAGGALAPCHGLDT